MLIRRMIVQMFMCVALSLAGCSPGFQHVREMPAWLGGESLDQHVQRVGTVLAVGAAAWCSGRQSWTYGLRLEPAEDPVHRHSHAGFPVVSYVYLGLPADKAGIKPGDAVRTLDGQAINVSSGEQVLIELDRLARARIQPVTLGVGSDSNLRQVDLFAVPRCPVQFEVIDYAGINAVADGVSIVVTSGMIRFLHSDEELAWVLAHELAHTVMEHSQSSRLEHSLEAMLGQMAVQGQVLGKAERVDLEIQADSVAVSILAQAGFDLKQARRALERFADLYAQQPEQFHSSTHSVPPERLALFDRTVADIEGRQARGEPLPPVNQRP